MTAPAAARIFPNDRLSYRYNATEDRVASAAGAKVWLFEDQAMTVSAVLRLYPSGAPVADGMVSVGADSLIPEFWEESGKGLEVLWALPENATTASRLDSRLADRVAAVEAMTSTGAGGRNFYRYDQLVPASVWSVTHTLVRMPTVTVLVDGEAVDTDVTYPSATQVVAVFPEPVTGTLLCT